MSYFLVGSNSSINIDGDGSGGYLDGTRRERSEDIFTDTNNKLITSNTCNRNFVKINKTYTKNILAESEKENICHTYSHNNDKEFEYTKLNKSNDFKSYSNNVRLIKSPKKPEKVEIDEESQSLRPPSPLIFTQPYTNFNPEECNSIFELEETPEEESNSFIYYPSPLVFTEQFVEDTCSENIIL